MRPPPPPFTKDGSSLLVVGSFFLSVVRVSAFASKYQLGASGLGYLQEPTVEETDV